MKKTVSLLACATLLATLVGCTRPTVTSTVTTPVTTESTTLPPTDTTTATATSLATTATTSKPTTTATTATTASAKPTTTSSTKKTTTTTRKTTTTTKLQLPPLQPGAPAAYEMVQSPIQANINAASAVLYDATHDVILYQKNMSGNRAPASITKVLTAIVAVNKLPLDTMMKVGSEQNLVAGAASRAFLQQGGWYSLRTLLEAMLIPSGCDAAYTIAVNVARISSGRKNLTDRQALDLFVRYMNQTAHDIGATHSSFKCPDGFPTGGHYTTAVDLLTIARKARTYSTLREIMSKPVSSNGEWYGTNALIKSYSAYYYKGANGMKTGTSNEAGNCVMASARRNGIDLIVIVLGSGYRYEDAVTLLDKGFAKAATLNTTTATKPTATTTRPTTTSTQKPTASTTTTTAPTTTATTPVTESQTTATESSASE